MHLPEVAVVDRVAATSSPWGSGGQMNQVAVHDLDIEIKVIGQQGHQCVDITDPEVSTHWHTPDRRVSNDELLIGIATDFRQDLLQRFALEYQRSLPPRPACVPGFRRPGVRWTR